MRASEIDSTLVVNSVIFSWTPSIVVDNSSILSVLFSTLFSILSNLVPNSLPESAPSNWSSKFPVNCSTVSRNSSISLYASVTPLLITSTVFSVCVILVLSPSISFPTLIIEFSISISFCARVKIFCLRVETSDPRLLFWPTDCSRALTVFFNSPMLVLTSATSSLRFAAVVCILLIVPWFATTVLCTILKPVCTISTWDCKFYT